MTPISYAGRDDALEAVQTLLAYAEPHAGRPGLAETPERFVKALEEYTSGYHQNPFEVLKVFEDGAEGANEMVIQTGIPFYSLCEHHLAPFFGTVDIAYIPAGKIVGLSKLSRLTNVFARRLQVQERLTCQIADALYSGLECLGVGVRVQARHLCMEARGVRSCGSQTTTQALRGVMYSEPEVRAEFLAAIRG